MPDLSRRGFLAISAAAGAARALPPIAVRVRSRRVLTLIYDKAVGAMRAVDRVVR